jgi:hypothetical protein
MTNGYLYIPGSLEGYDRALLMGTGLELIVFF